MQQRCMEVEKQEENIKQKWAELEAREKQVRLEEEKYKSARCKEAIKKHLAIYKDYKKLERQFTQGYSREVKLFNTVSTDTVPSRMKAVCDSFLEKVRKSYNNWDIRDSSALHFGHIRSIS